MSDSPQLDAQFLAMSEDLRQHAAALRVEGNAQDAAYAEQNARWAEQMVGRVPQAANWQKECLL